MKFNAELQYIEDTQLVEKLAVIDLFLTKEANFLGSALGTVAGGIKSFVEEHVDSSSPASLIKSVLKLLEPGYFFKIHPLLGILSTIGQMFGFSVVDILSSVVGSIAPKLENGMKVSAQEVNQAVVATVGLDSEASYDLFYDLKKYAEDGDITKKAISPFKSGPKAPLLQRVLPFLGPRKSRTLVGAFIGWFIKTILLSAGLLGGAELLNNMVFTPAKEKVKTILPTTPEGITVEQVRTKPSVALAPQAPSHNLKPSGRGEKEHQNNDQNVWVVPIYGSVQNTLAMWTQEIYPELVGKLHLVRSSASFNRVANILDSYLDAENPNYLVVPAGYTNRKEIVDMFIGETAQKLQQQEQK